MLFWGDQWICRCGTHNFELRLKCRNCSSDKKDSETSSESWVEGMEHTIIGNEIDSLLKDAGIEERNKP